MSDKELIKQELKRRISNLEELGDRKYIEEFFTEQFRFIEIYESLINFIDSLPEESGCEVNFTTKSDDLEREIGRYTTNCLLGKRNHSTGVYHLTQRNCDDIARHFAEWQKQKDFEDYLKSDMTIPNKFYEKGRFDMQQEMMKTLIGGEVVKDIHNQLSVKSEPLNNAFGDIKFGEKVKIIIVKTEQQ